PAPQALEAVEDAEAREVSPHPVARGARGDAKLQAELPRRVQVLEHAGQHRVGEDHLGSASDPAIEHLLREGLAQALLQMMLGMEAGRRRADDLHPALGITTRAPTASPPTQRRPAERWPWWEARRA